MFKIEVNTTGGTIGHYWANRHEDDFLQFLPKHFTREYGEEITKDDITAYKIDESNLDIVEGHLAASPFNVVDCCNSEAGKLKVCRIDEAVMPAGWYPKAVAEEFKARRESIFSDSANPVTVTLPAESTYDFGEGAIPAYEIPAAHEVTTSYMSCELELTGIALTKWPYSVDGKFLGNK